MAGNESSSLADQLPLESFEDLPDDALCVICQQPSTDNVSMCLKGHNACRTCATKWVNSDNANYDKCASCRVLLHRPYVPGQGNVWVSNMVLNNLVDTFQIKCANVKVGCTHMCKLTEMSEHMKACEWREMACKCSGCTWKGPVCKWHQHMQDQDHGCHLVDMLLFTQGVCATMVEKFEAAEAVSAKFQTEHFQPLKTQIDCIGSGQNSMKDQLRVIEGYTKKPDGSSERSKRRDRKNAKDVDEANQVVERATADKATAESERDELKRRLDEIEAAPPPPPPVTTLSLVQFQSCQSTRDRFFRERDEARHESYMAQQRIHDQHTMLKKMMPHAVSSCPCTLVNCDSGGGQRNCHAYARGLKRRTVEEAMAEEREDGELA